MAVRFPRLRRWSRSLRAGRLRGARRWIAWTLVLALPAVVLLENLLLWTGAIEALVTRERNTSRIQLRHGWAWTIWPTRVHLHDADLMIDAYSYQLAVAFESGVADIELLDLLQRRVHFSEITAEGVRAQWRAKVDADEAADPDLAAYPPFDGTPVRVQSPVPKPIPGPEEAWSVDLDDVDAELSTLWIDEFDVQPCGHVRGAMHWIDGGEFSVPTTTVSLDGATLWLGDRVAIDRIVGDGELTLAPFDSGNTPGAAIPAMLSFAFTGAGELVEPAALEVWWPQIATSIDQGSGPLELDVEARDGQLLAGSRVHHHASRIGLGPVRARTHAESDVVLTVERDGRPSAEVVLIDAVLSTDAQELAHSDRIHGRLHVDHGTLDRPWSLADAHVEGAPIVVDELARLDEAVGGEGWAFTRGSARVVLVADVDGDTNVVADIEARLRHAAFASGSVRIAADVRAGGRFRTRPGGPIAFDDLSLRTADLALRSDGGESTGTWVRLHGGKLRKDDDGLTLDVRGEVEDARPALVHLTRLDPLVKAVPDLPRTVPVELHARLAVADDTITLDVLRARQLGFDVLAAWRKRGDHWRAAVLVTGLAALGLELDDHGLQRLVPLVGKPWLTRVRGWVRGGPHPKLDAK